MNEKKDYPNSGAFFVNNKKRPDKKDPDYNGQGEITCCKCGHRNQGWLNIWSKSGAKGDFWSWAFKHKDEQPSQSSGASSGGGRSLSSGSQTDMGYSRESRPRDRDEQPPSREKRDWGKDVSDDIPF